MFKSRSRKARFKDLTYGLYPQLFKLATARLGNEQDAEDVVQEAYTRAYKAFDTLKDPANTAPWLVQILLNVLKDHVRRVSRQPAMIPLEDIPEDHAATVQEDADPERKLTDMELSPNLLEALQAMPEAFLSPLLLRQIYGASYQEIATILKIPIGTVMSRLARGRALLKVRLTQRHESDSFQHTAVNPGDRQAPGGEVI